MNHENLLKETLLQLQGKIETIEEIEKAKGERFNLFSILKMERLEVETHSAFIYELLNQNASHSQGILYLKLFFEEVLSDCKILNYKDLLIKREHYVEEEGRIDFTISNKDTFIAIEMKIDAPDQTKQLQRYINIAQKKGIDSKVYYLTLNGKSASVKSIEDSSEDSELYTKISFSKHIIQWLLKCIEKSARLPTIRENLIQYLNLIYKLTGKTNEEIRMEIENMIDNQNIAHAATEMSKNIGYIWAKKEAYFWDEVSNNVIEKSEKIGWEWNCSKVFFDENDEYLNDKDIASSIDKLRSSKNGDVGISFEKTINKREVTLKLYQYNTQSELKYQLDEIEGYGEDKMTKLAKQLNLDYKNKGSRYGSSNISINFYGKNVSEPTYQLFDDKILKKFIEETSADILTKLKIIDKQF